MVAMALAALRPVVLIERLLVLAAVEQTRIGRVAKAATAAHAGDTGWTGSVIAVAGIACRRAQVAALKQRTAMHTVAIFCQLSGRQRGTVRTCEPGHDCGVGVARPASFGHALGIHL